MTVKMYLQLNYSHHSLFGYLGVTQSLWPYITETQKNCQKPHSKDLQGLSKSHILEDIGTWTAALSLLCQDEQQNHKQILLHCEGIQTIYNFI